MIVQNRQLYLVGEVNRLTVNMAKLLLLFLLAIGGYTVWKLTCCCGTPKPPQLDQQQWWGPRDLKAKADNSIKPFKIQFTEEMIKDLRARLSSRRPLTPPLEGISMEYGMNTNQLEGLLKYWEKDYPFKQRETYLNQFPQFKTNIQGLDIHFIRVKPETKPGVEVLPLILLHGWPGSVVEFYETIPLLTKPRAGVDFVFEVIVPSLPGYGFSDAAIRPGLGAAQIGVVFKNLMNRLGHKKFYIQGGDWGSAIGSSMATLYPEEVLGLHTNLAFVMANKMGSLKTLAGAFVPSLVVEDHLADRMYPLSSFFSYLLEEFGYFHLQATKPDTVGVALTDSPSGLASYILEKFASWTIRKSKSIPDHLSKNGLFDNLMLYWVPNKITTSMRLYSESQTNSYRALNMDEVPTPVPTWATQVKHELFYQPPSILKHKFTNLLGVTVVEKGGHFLAFEYPQLLSDDVFKAVKEFRKWNSETAQKKTEL